MHKLIIGTSLALVLACGPAAADTLYKCNYATSRTTKEPGKYDLFVQYDGRSDRAMAMDAFAYDKVRHPDLVPVRVRSLGGGEFRLQWEVDDVRKGSYSSDVSYIARLDVQALTLDVTISPVAYPPPWHFTGACIAEKLK